jgi:hypothetical protein
MHTYGWLLMGGDDQAIPLTLAILARVCLNNGVQKAYAY